MRNSILMTAAVTLSLSAAGAQKITFSDSASTYLLRGCAFTQAGLQCDLTFTPGSDDRYFFDTGKFHVVTPDGVPVVARQVKAAGGGWTNSTTSWITSYQGLAYQVSVLFDVPKTTRSLPVFSAYGSTLRNVMIGGAATPPATTPPAPTLNLPATQAVIGGKAYTISFTNCAASGNGAFTCRSVLTPAR